MPIPAGGDSTTDIVTVAEVKKQLNIDPEDTSQDDELAGYVAAVTEVVEDIVGPVITRDVEETHDGGTEVVILRRPPILSITSITEEGTAVAGTGYTASLESGVLYRTGGWWAGGRGAVTVVYRAGQVPIPAGVKLAAKELVMVNFRPQLGGDYSPFDTDAPGEGTPGEVRLGFFVPNRVRELLKPHEQGGWLP